MKYGAKILMRGDRNTVLGGSSVYSVTIQQKECALCHRTSLRMPEFLWNSEVIFLM